MAWSYPRHSKILCEAVGRKTLFFPKPLLCVCVRPTFAIMIHTTLPVFLTSLLRRDEVLVYIIGFLNAKPE